MRKLHLRSFSLFNTNLQSCSTSNLTSSPWFELVAGKPEALELCSCTHSFPGGCWVDVRVKAMIMATLCTTVYCSLTWLTLLTMSSFITLPIVSQAQQGFYIYVHVCLHGSAFVTVFCRRNFILLSPSPASQFCLLEDIMIMEVMLHHVCQVQQMFFCSANHLPKANCLHVKQFFSAHPLPFLGHALEEHE